MEYVDILKEVSQNEKQFDNAWIYDDNNRIKNFLYHRLYNGYDRLKHDCDAYYYNKIGCSNAYHGDTMVSFWMPYQSRINKEPCNGNYYMPNNNDKPEERLKKIKGIKELIEKPNDKIIELNNNLLLKRFSEIVYTKGNFMLLQFNKKFKKEGREMQGRGSFDVVCDEIDWTLKQCHNGGIYFKYFDYDENKVNEWIKREKLEMADSAFLSSNMFKLYQDMTDDEFYEYLSKVIELIEYRNENYHPEEFII